MIVIEEGAFYLVDCLGGQRRVMTDEGYAMEFPSYALTEKYAKRTKMVDYQIVVEVKKEIVCNENN